MEMKTHDRYDYVPLPDRPVYDWPGGKRLAVCIANNIEHFSFLTGLGADHTIPGAPQTQRNYAWRDYGNRVGMWYYFDMLDEYELPTSHNVNSTLLDAAPQIVARIKARGDEVVGHGRTNSERQDGMAEADERRLIDDTTEAIVRHFGAPPAGWLGPYIVQSAVTLDLLKEAGYAYMMDWPADDQPFWMRTRAGPILSVPYSIELNDSPAFVYRHHTGRQFAEMMIDQFDEMMRQSKKYPLVYSAVAHPFLIAQPHRLAPLRTALDHILARRDDVWITTPGEVARHIASLPAGTVPGAPD